MMYKRSFRTLLAVFFVASCAVAQQKVLKPSAPEAERLRAHVSYLASDRLEGRKTGTQGAKDAADYIAAQFMQYGLAAGGHSLNGFGVEPSRNREYRQWFPYVAAVELGKGNAMTLAARGGDAPQSRLETLDLRVGEDWMPLGFGTNARVESTPVVFVGYGITAPESNYDDYAGVGVKDKIALALAGTPDGDNPHGRFMRSGEIRFKAAAARAAGARALVVVAGEDNFRDDKLSRLSYENAGGDAGLPVVAISRQAAAKVLGLGGLPQLAEFEKARRESVSSQPGVKDASGPAPAAQTPQVELSIATDVVRRNAPAANVVGILHGSDPRLRDEVIVVGAHYDHLGRGGHGSLAAREGEVHHGADDNASGTAALLELARLLSKEREKMRRTVVFVAFGGEEEGLLGSSHYVNHPTQPLERTVAMINMDMVGRLRGDALMIGGVGTAAEWRQWIEGANRGFKVSVDPMGRGMQTADASSGAKVDAPVVVTGSNGRVVATAVPEPRFNLRLNEDGFGPSDHSSFYAKRIPVLFFFTGTHEDYHKPTDTADRINYEGLARVGEFVRQIVYELQASDKRPTFTLAKVEATARSTGFNVYLGTVPSYGESSDGLKLDAVREGSPAEKAGIKAGDRIVKLAGRDVRNVYDYTQALSGMKAGQEYEAEVVRDGQRLTLKVTPAARK